MDVVLLGQCLLTFLMSVVIFFSLTTAGGSANLAHNFLKVKVLESIDNILDKVPYEIEIMSTYKILSESITNVPIDFTAGDMFSINKTLILTTAGAMVTYGVLMFQF
ncbi:uncharacterized protein CDAR_531 [Caerostris darwini]|uniref:Uncharacterized protein n=1 Tax=Caerostris darwini TaxID=1538125 RepID=A0AAV4UC30_9ARAC|nr:uncharacterized protein CDAR_531 [Caerostris darwini]